MAGHHSVAKSVRLDKEAHPERFCPRSRCLWKTGGGYCPRHTENTAPVLVACMAPGCVVRFTDGVDGAVHLGGLAVCDACAGREAMCADRHASKHDDAVWARFTLLGFQDDDVERLELRNCPMCSSTVGRFVEKSR
jgi:hypothetical protein